MRAFAHDVFTYPPPGTVSRSASTGWCARRPPPPGRGRPRRHRRRGWDDLRRTHTADWVERVRDGRLERREQLGLGLPWSPELVEPRPPRDRRNDPRGTRGARGRRRGESRRRDAPRLCGRRPRLLRLQRRRHRPARDAAERRVDRVIVVDVDVHQGDDGRACSPRMRAPSRSRSTASATTRSAASRRPRRRPSGRHDGRPLSPRWTRRSPARPARPAGLCFVLAGVTRSIGSAALR